ncbi:MAG: NHLP bacteriocin system secretion protein [Candidatus Margulisiibacteriota bacterium]|jgi:HlyD family secretion protein
MFKVSLFRKKALAKDHSNESLDLTVKIISPQGWIALVGAGLIIFFFVIWSYVGTISDIVTGQGIIMKGSGNFEVLSEANGIISDIKIEIGDTVRKGDIIARITQQQLLDEIEANRLMLNLLIKKRELSIAVNKKQGRFQLEALGLNNEAQKDIIKNYKKEANYLNYIIGQQKILLHKGLITKEDFFKRKANYYQILENISIAQNQINQNLVTHLSIKKQKVVDILSYDEEIKQTATKLQALEKQLHQTSNVHSQVSGKVNEIDISEGTVIAQGQKIATIEKSSKLDIGNKAIIYINAGDGKRVRVGMVVQISPSTAKVEQWGSMIGIVASVSEFPVSSEAIQRTLQNELLVKELTAKGTPIEIRVNLIPSTTTYSGYKWTSSTGPHFKIYSGTICTSTIIVEKQRPINKVIPYFRKTFGPYYDLTPPK